MAEMGETTVVDKRPKYARYFDIAITLGIGGLMALLVVRQHGIKQRLDELLELAREDRADALEQLEREYAFGEPAGDDLDDEK